MTIYCDTFLNALGAWQKGWLEDHKTRNVRTRDLVSAVEAIDALPSEATTATEKCFRKRFLVPNNPQNDGDFWPFFWDGFIEEGVASWSFDYNYCKLTFKTDLRENEIACIFGRMPQADEVVLNIKGLWSIQCFRDAVDNYKKRGCDNADAILHFRDRQSEVILRSPLYMGDVVAFCERVPSLEQVMTLAGISSSSNEEAIWQKMVDLNLFPKMNYWLEDAAAQKAIDNAIAVIETRFRKFLKPKAEVGA